MGRVHRRDSLLRRRPHGHRRDSLRLLVGHGHMNRAGAWARNIPRLVLEGLARLEAWHLLLVFPNVLGMGVASSILVAIEVVHRSHIIRRKWL